MRNCFTLFLFIFLFPLAANAQEQTAADEGHIKVALRMVGHRLLLQSGNSTSRVLPVEKEAEGYRLRFASDFQFAPEQLVALVDSVVTVARLSASYRLEVEDCRNKQVVYSYEMGNAQRLDLVPCQGRLQPRGCYTLYFMLLDDQNYWPVQAKTEASEAALPVEKRTANPEVIAIALALVVLIGFSFYTLKKRTKTAENKRLIGLGEYQFDPQNMLLRHQDVEVELTSKEADLLLLLCNSANSTLEREHILKAVWDDEGDYVGRTLDVFISRLRKKLEADSRLKIANVRGVGYKLIVNV